MLLTSHKKKQAKQDRKLRRDGAVVFVLGQDLGQVCPVSVRYLQIPLVSKVPFLIPERNTCSFIGCSVSIVVWSCGTVTIYIFSLCSVNPRHSWHTDHLFCKSDISQMCQASYKSAELFFTCGVCMSQIPVYLTALYVKKLFLQGKNLAKYPNIHLHLVRIFR